MKSFFYSLLLIWSVSSTALETDNYLAWDKTLSDSSVHINQYLSETIERALMSTPEHQKKSCQEMTILIGEDFESHLVHDNPVENWLFTVLSEEEMYPLNLNYVERSIYREPYRFYIPWFGLAPTIQVNGYYFGTDKLSHFASTGLIYYKIFMKELLKGKSSRAALQTSIDWGVLDEKTVHGFWASGVFSYADLEANYQGLRFYQRFCSSLNPYLRKSATGEWILDNVPDIKMFVRGSWDESFYLSYRKPQNWEKVAPILRNEYCSKVALPRVQKRVSYYKRDKNLSESQKYLFSLKDAPKAQSFDDLCRE